MLRGHTWPGNLRELQSVLKQALLHAKGYTLLPEFLPVAFTRRQGAPTLTVTAAPGMDLFITERLEHGTTNLYAEGHALVHRRLFARVLDHTKGNQLRAAKILGLTRGKLPGLLRSLGMGSEGGQWSAGDQPPGATGSPETNSGDEIEMDETPEEKMGPEGMS